MENTGESLDLSTTLEKLRTLCGPGYEGDEITETVEKIYKQVAREGWPLGEPEATLDDLLDRGGEAGAEEWLTAFLAQASQGSRENIYRRVTEHLLGRLEDLLDAARTQEKGHALPALLAANYLALDASERTRLLDLLRLGRDSGAPGFDHQFVKDLVLVNDSIYDIIKGQEA